MAGTLCLVGGTFDRLHLGHHALLEAACKCDQVEVWLSADAIAREKDPRIESHDDRTESILNWASNCNLSVHLLEDPWGPAPQRSDATHIVCTTETKANCIRINEMRLENELDELEIVEVEHILANDGLPISSSRIREGSIDREGNLWIRQTDLEKPVHMVKLLDSE